MKGSVSNNEIRFVSLGIAAANIEIPKTDVSASTLHALFDGCWKTSSALELMRFPFACKAPFHSTMRCSRFQEFDGEFKTRMDFTKLTNSKIAELLQMQVLMLDEISMIDTDCRSLSSMAHAVQMRDRRVCIVALALIQICRRLVRAA